MNTASLHQRILEVLASGIPMTVSRLAGVVSRASGTSGMHATLRAVRALEQRGAVGLHRADVDGRQEWLSWAPGDPTALLRHAELATPSSSPRPFDLDAHGAASGGDNLFVWTLHAAPFVSKVDGVIAVRRRARLETDGFVSFDVAGRPEGLVHARELALRGHARSCACRDRAWHPLLDVFDHSPTIAERQAWAASRAAHRRALSPARTDVWILFPGEASPSREDRAVRCSTRPASAARSGRGSRRTDLEVRTPLRGFEGHVIDGLDLATRGFTSLKIGASVYVVSATPPDGDTRARCARARAAVDEVTARADAAAFLAPSATTRVSSPTEALRALGLTKAASARDVARAFRRRVMEQQAHPDLGGSAHEFAELIRLRDLALTLLARA